MRFVLVSCIAIVFVSTGCASLAIGYERGQAHVVAHSEDGVAYLERRPADAAGDVVVMLHGFGADKDNWDAFCAHMPPDLWLIAPDLPGFGDSARDPQQSYDVDSEVQMLARFLAARGITRFHLLGNSFGGWVAAGYALAHPDQIESLVLFDPAGIEPPGGFREPKPVRTIADFDAMLTHVFATPPQIPDALKQAMVDQAIAHEAFNQKIAGDLRAHPGTVGEHVDELKPPALVVWGADDHVLDVATAALWRARIPGHLVVVLPKTGHVPMIERPAESAALVLTWWKNEKLLHAPAVVAR